MPGAFNNAIKIKCKNVFQNAFHNYVLIFTTQLYLDDFDKFVQVLMCHTYNNSLIITRTAFIVDIKRKTESLF